MGRTIARVWGGARARRGEAWRGEGRWGVPGIVMQIVLGEANVSREGVLFLAMIPGELGGKTKERGKEEGKESNV